MRFTCHRLAFILRFPKLMQNVPGLMLIVPGLMLIVPGLMLIVPGLVLIVPELMLRLLVLRCIGYYRRSSVCISCILAVLCLQPVCRVN